MVKVFIGVLVAVVLVLLYRGMLREQAAVDPMAPLDAKKILAVLQAYHQPCDTVDSFTPLGSTENEAWDAYLSRCHDGGRYLYFESRPRGRVDAMSCTEQAFRYSYRCPN